MSWLATLALAILHAVYWLVITAKSICRTWSATQPLNKQRKQIPRHLALTLVAGHHAQNKAAESLMAESLERAVAWCRVIGIHRLTVYDREGTLAHLSPRLRERLYKLFDTTSTDSASDSEIEYPLTPPPSDDSDSRPLSPNDKWHKLSVTTIELTSKKQRKSSVSKNGVRRRRTSRRDSTTPPFTLHIVSRESGKPAVSQIANEILRRRLREGTRDASGSDSFEASPASLEQELDAMLEGKDGFPSPDLMIVHEIFPGRKRLPLELHGFPPWQIRLTEFYHDSQSGASNPWAHSAIPKYSSGRPLDEETFSRALDTYAAAEMRLGK
ncbi:hypothetical protein WOLCODRAFT_160272 [Wolfiporia cocos MD-104 SS10]|uniref:ditrans,polycis-polyprenyl diphosphate synthase [(2E,6E)-farnesyldiphosphate specific] n=1 Tax=Wolfiporia cocos (strain MD-104) TaxID=742152 RepID=A0A2H3JAL2_WOLCO|nr:hypothetical protein WOLCODRAFT_160272 [Wolfiporia cocos MD-104 SS10]